MCAPKLMAEMGLSARTRESDGALLERWRAQCGTTGTLYRNLPCRVFAAQIADSNVYSRPHTLS